MAGALLRSGSLREFHPLGAVGNPVYSAAGQLRAAVRRQVNAEVADVFAVPRQNEQGDVIDWYAPNQGDVVPWSAATLEQRTRAKAKLLEVRELLQERSAELQRHEGSEQQIFGQLLAEVTKIPSDEHVYLVHGRPVVTFWGFDPLDPPPGLDVIADLDTGVPEPPRPLPGSTAGSVAKPVTTEAPIAPATIVAERGRSGWWWLLLLLLLLPLLFALLWLRGCWGTTLPAGLDLPLGDLRVQTDDPAEIDGEYVEYEGERYRLDRERSVLLDSRTNRVVRELSQGEMASLLAAESESQGEREGSPEGPTSPPTEPPVDDSAAGGDSPEDQTAASEPESKPDSDLEPEPEAMPGEEPAPAGDEAQAPKTEPAEKPRAPPGDESLDPAGRAGNQPPQQAPSGPPPGGATQPAQPSHETPLTIPPQAADSGSSDFLSGKWRSLTTLMGPDGRPVELSYDFKKGAGTVDVRRSTPTGEQTCAGQVGSEMRDGKLVINQRAIRCPDGASFQDSTVECAVGENGRADCQGVNQDGTQYGVKIVK